MKMPDTTFDFYYSSYCGGKAPVLEKADFDRIIRSATQEVGDFITFEGDCSLFGDQIKNCVCRVAEALFKGEASKGIKSENTDGYSVTYADTDGGRAEVRSVVQAELGNTGLLFLGVE